MLARVSMLNDDEAQSSKFSIDADFDEMKALCNAYLTHLNSHLDAILHPEKVTENEPTLRERKTQEIVRIYNEIPRIQVLLTSENFERELTAFNKELLDNRIINIPRPAAQLSKQTNGNKFINNLLALTHKINIKYSDLLLPDTANDAERIFFIEIARSLHRYEDLKDCNNHLTANAKKDLSQLLNRHDENGNANSIVAVKKFISSPAFRQGMLAETTSNYLYRFFDSTPTPAKIFLNELDRHVALFDRRLIALTPETPSPM
jgi:hypothetical protein